MDRAAVDAAGGQAALAASCTADISTPGRVRHALKAGMAGVGLLSRHNRLGDWKALASATPGAFGVLVSAGWEARHGA